MEKQYILLESETNLNSVINQTFQATQRIKLISFDVSRHYIIFGASSGGLYIFERQPCQFKKLIPSKGGTAELISVSPNEKNVAIANAKGLVIVIENCFTEDTCRYQIYSEHEGQTVTALRWHGVDLYTGDSNGKVSVILSLNLLTKAIFQTSVAAILHLESPIVQIDCFNKYLLVSTRGRTYLCDTENEHFKPIGKKLRDGPLGACFLCGCAKPNQNAVTDSRLQYKEHKISSEDTNLCKIYCSRPGGRLWEANFEGAVIYTHQFRNNYVNKQQSEVIVLADDTEARISVVDHSNTSAPQNFSFEKLYVFSQRFLLTFSKNSFYIIDPLTGTLMFRSNLYDNINDIKIFDSKLFIWQNKQIFTFTISSVEDIIIETLFHKKYYACAELSIKYSEDVIEMVNKSSKIHLIGILKRKLSELGDTDLLEKVSPLLEKIQNLSQQKLNDNLSNGIKIVENAYFVEEDESTIDDINIGDSIINLKTISLVGEKINEGTRKIKENLQVFETKMKKLASDSAVKNTSVNSQIIETIPKQTIMMKRNDSRKKIQPEPSNIQEIVEDINPDDTDYKLRILLEQYKLNKIHKNVETTRVSHLLEKSDLSSLKEVLEMLTNHVNELMKEDANMWCKQQFLKHVYKSKKYKDIANLESNILEYLYECFCDVNSSKHSACSCGYPLPNASNQKPLYYDIGLALANMISDISKMRSKVPFMWRHYLNSLPEDDIYMNLQLIIQYNDLELIKTFSKYFFYDNWDDVTKLYIRLKDGYCLKCDNKIDNKRLINWTDFGLLMLRSTGGPNTMKLMQLYAKHIPKGELTAEFYQACIFASSVGGLENTFGSKPLDLFLELNNKAQSKLKLQKTLATFLKKKYTEDTVEAKFLLPSVSCGVCDMPVNIQVLENKVLKCGHSFHNVCLLYIENSCTLCNKAL